jgi:hypothetical protein
MSRITSVKIPEAEELQTEPAPAKPDEEVVPAEDENQPRTRLDVLMRALLARRDAMRATREKLRDSEIELRRASTASRGRFERMRGAALKEHRAAQGEAARTRQQLITTLGMRRIEQQ